MKKLLSLALVAALCMSLLVGCGNSGNNSSAANESSTEASKADESSAAQESSAAEEASVEESVAEEASEAPAEPAATDIKVAMITDYGDITDQSFNQTTYEACKSFCEATGLDFTYYKPASDSDDDRVAMMESAIDDGYTVIVTPGYAFGAALAEVAPEYEDVIFIALDVSAGDFPAGFEIPSNLYSAVYQEELCGYMAGYAAVKLGYTKLGFLGGMAVPAVVRYGYGYVQGVDAAAAELGLTDVEVNYIYGGIFYGDTDITAVMDTWYEGGTEIVFACGGGIYTSAAEAAQKYNGKVIGVDVDQAAIIDGNYGEGMTVTSAMKGLAATVNTMLQVVVDGKFSEYGGKIDNLGLVSETPSENYVQIAGSTQFSDTFTEEDYAALVKAMLNGEITVSNDTTVTADSFATVIKVNDQGSIR